MTFWDWLDRVNHGYYSGWYIQWFHLVVTMGVVAVIWFTAGLLFHLTAFLAQWTR